MNTKFTDEMDMNMWGIHKIYHAGDYHVFSPKTGPKQSPSNQYKYARVHVESGKVFDTGKLKFLNSEQESQAGDFSVGQIEDIQFVVVNSTESMCFYGFQGRDFIDYEPIKEIASNQEGGKNYWFVRKDRLLICQEVFNRDENRKEIIVQILNSSFELEYSYSFPYDFETFVLHEDSWIDFDGENLILVNMTSLQREIHWTNIKTKKQNSLSLANDHVNYTAVYVRQTKLISIGTKKADHTDSKLDFVCEHMDVLTAEKSYAILASDQIELELINVSGVESFELGTDPLKTYCFEDGTAVVKPMYKGSSNDKKTPLVESPGAFLFFHSSGETSHQIRKNKSRVVYFEDRIYGMDFKEEGHLIKYEIFDIQPNGDIGTRWAGFYDSVEYLAGLNFGFQVEESFFFPEAHFDLEPKKSRYHVIARVELK